MYLAAEHKPEEPIRASPDGSSLGADDGSIKGAASLPHLVRWSWAASGRVHRCYVVLLELITEESYIFREGLLYQFASPVIVILAVRAVFRRVLVG